MLFVESAALQKNGLEVQYQEAMKLLAQETHNVSKKNKDALECISLCVEQGHKKSMYLYYQIVTSDFNLSQDSQKLQKAYVFLCQAALKGHTQALEVMKDLENRGYLSVPKESKAHLNFHRGLLYEREAEETRLKAQKCYRVAIENGYQPNPGQFTRLYEDEKKRIEHPEVKREKKRPRVDLESKTTTTSSTVTTESYVSSSIISTEAVIPNSVSEKTEPPSGEDVQFLFNKGIAHFDNYKKTTDRQQLELAIESFSNGWEKYNDYNCYYQWGLALLESEEEQFRLKGVEMLVEVAYNYSSNVWNFVGQLFESGCKVKKDIEKAKLCYRQGIGKKQFLDPPTQLFNLVIDEFHNEWFQNAMNHFTKENFLAAFDIFKDLSHRGHLPSKYQYAKMLVQGLGCDLDWEEAGTLLGEVIQSKVNSSLVMEAQELLNNIQQQ